MASKVLYTSVDAHNSYKQSLFWAEVLGYAEDPDDPNLPDHEECLIRSPDGSHGILFINVPDEKTVKNRLHFDLRPTDRTRDEEVERVIGLGARRADIGQGEQRWVVLADPEDNEFCILMSAEERAAYLAANG